MNFYRVSQFFQPKIIVPPGKERAIEFTSTSQKLLSNLGLVRSSGGGTNVLLPIAVRAIEKLKKMIQKELELVGAQEIAFPALTSRHLFKQTGRDSLPELFNVKDRHSKEFFLSPTHEEAVVSLVASIKPSYKNLPLLLYQMSTKFRDEMKPRFGLMRSKEFLMKDLYCFESSVELSQSTYSKINDCYDKVFKKLKVPFCCVEGDPGEIGGTLSHEFHIASNVGEDRLFLCNDCGHGQKVINITDTTKCLKCQGSNTTQQGAIEVAHSFLLGTRYTKPLNASFVTSDNSLKLLEMSCHGIGVSRLLAAGVEALSTQQEIRWPNGIAPFSVCIIPPKAGSIEVKSSVSPEELTLQLTEVTGNDLVVDDRTELTIGKRLANAKQMGYPYIIVIGKESMKDTPQIELHDLCHATCDYLSPPDTPLILKQKLKANA